MAACASPRPDDKGLSDASGALLLTNVHIVPMDSERVLHRYSILVRDGIIQEVGPSGAIAAPRDVQRIDGGGSYVLPSLTDSHVHLRSQSELLSYLAHGVTTVAHLSGSAGEGFDPLRLRSRTASGETLGPTIFTSGPILDGNPPIFASVSTVVTMPAAAAAAVRGQIAQGFDFVKIYNNLEPDVMRSAIATAHDLGRAVFGHIPRRGGRDRALQRALDAGLDVIAGARGRVTRYLTGAEGDLTLDGFTLRTIETTVLTLDSAGVAIRRLRERFAPVIGTATWGAFEVPDSSGGGWRVQQEFRLVAIRRP